MKGPEWLLFLWQIEAAAAAGDLSCMAAVARDSTLNTEYAFCFKNTQRTVADRLTVRATSITSNGDIQKYNTNF